MMKRVLFLLLLLTATPALAQSNIGLSQYPAPSCVKPAAVDETQKPATPRQNANDDEVQAYNRRVDAYNLRMRGFNEQLGTYNTCIQAYMANGKADMERIQSVLNAAVAAANAK